MIAAARKKRRFVCISAAKVNWVDGGVETGQALCGYSLAGLSTTQRF